MSEPIRARLTALNEYMQKHGIGDKAKWLGESAVDYAMYTMDEQRQAIERLEKDLREEQSAHQECITELTKACKEIRRQETMTGMLIDLHASGVLSEGQVSHATGMHRLAVRRAVDALRGQE